MRFLQLMKEMFAAKRITANKYYDVLRELEQAAYLELEDIQKEKEKVFQAKILPHLMKTE